MVLTEHTCEVLLQLKVLHPALGTFTFCCGDLPSCSDISGFGVEIVRKCGYVCVRAGAR